MARDGTAPTAKAVETAAMLRREFDLSEEDEEYLDARGLPWETIIQCNSRWVLIHRFPVPAGYTSKVVTVALSITSGYPTAQLDMVYVHPALALVNGAAIRALTSIQLDGKVYQRWSRHRTPLNPWRPGLDNIATHVSLVEEWFTREVGGQ